MADLMTRQTFQPFTLEHENIQRDDKEVIENYKAKIQNTRRFDALNTGRKKDILKGKWKIGRWEEIGIKMGFDKRIIEQTYKFLCSYSHSGFISIMQLQTAISDKAKSPPLEGIIETVRIVLANMIDLYCIVFTASREELYKDEDAVQLVQKYLDMTGHI
jgi:hypothetical protein